MLLPSEADAPTSFSSHLTVPRRIWHRRGAPVYSEVFLFRTSPNKSSLRANKNCHRMKDQINGPGTQRESCKTMAGFRLFWFKKVAKYTNLFRVKVRYDYRTAVVSRVQTSRRNTWFLGKHCWYFCAMNNSVGWLYKHANTKYTLRVVV